MQTERQEVWRSTHLLTEDKKDLARLVLEEIRRGRDVTKTLRSHPLQGGGYLNKSMLVTIYNEMVAAKEIDEDMRLLERIRSSNSSLWAIPPTRSNYSSLAEHGLPTDAITRIGLSSAALMR